MYAHSIFACEAPIYNSPKELLHRLCSCATKVVCPFLLANVREITNSNHWQTFHSKTITPAHFYSIIYVIIIIGLFTCPLSSLVWEPITQDMRVDTKVFPRQCATSCCWFNYTVDRFPKVGDSTEKRTVKWNKNKYLWVKYEKIKYFKLH